VFTGIVETIGEVVDVQRIGADVRIQIKVANFANQTVNLGDSIACNGVCLTVVEVFKPTSAPILAFDVSVESLDHTLIGSWQNGTSINLELAMLPTTRFGGHIVSGHVDGVAELVTLIEDARSWRMAFKLPQNLQKYVAKKGSITINGISFTVNSVKNNLFYINVIPHTFKVTTLNLLSQGDQVHIEVDVIARYLERMLSGVTSIGSNITESFLADNGFS